MSDIAVFPLIGVTSTLLGSLAAIVIADRAAQRRHSIPCSLCSRPTGYPYPSDMQYRPTHCDNCKPKVEYHLAMIQADDGETPAT